MTNPNYATYSLDELYEVRQKIDLQAHPQRYAELQQEISRREQAAQRQTALFDQQDDAELESVSPRSKQRRRLIIWSCFLAGVLACSYFGVIPIKSFNLRASEHPYLFWVIVLWVGSYALSEIYEAAKALRCLNGNSSAPLR